MIARPDIFVFLASLVVIPAAYLLIPNRADYADLRFRDGDVLQALNDSIGMRDRAPDDAEAAYLLARTQIYMGEVDAAVATLRHQIDDKPDDPVLHLTLAELLSSVGRQAESIDLRLALPVHHLDAPARAELAGWLRYEGRHDVETDYLARLQTAGLATPAQSTRHVMLILSQGQTAEAMARLKTIDDATGLEDRQTRLTLLALLLEAGEAEDARQRARNWQSGQESPSLNEAITRVFDAYEFDNETD